MCGGVIIGFRRAAQENLALIQRRLKDLKEGVLIEDNQDAIR